MPSAGEIVHSFHCIDVVNLANYRLENEEESLNHVDEMVLDVTTILQRILMKLEAAEHHGAVMGVFFV